MKKGAKCKRCKGTGQIPTYAKSFSFLGMDMSDPKFITCPKCYGKGVKS